VRAFARSTYHQVAAGLNEFDNLPEENLPPKEKGRANNPAFAIPVRS
jgi:hypothetical protein